MDTPGRRVGAILGLTRPTGAGECETATGDDMNNCKTHALIALFALGGAAATLAIGYLVLA